MPENPFQFTPVSGPDPFRSAWQLRRWIVLALFAVVVVIGLSPLILRQLMKRISHSTQP